MFQRSHHPAGREGAAVEAELLVAGAASVATSDVPLAALTASAEQPAPLVSPATPPPSPAVPLTSPADAERAARATLRAQIARIEGELSTVLAERFPYVREPAPVGGPSAGPCLPGLGELERTRDALAARLGELRSRAARRSEHERRAAELLERMRLEPGRYRYYRVPVRDLGQGGCGVWEVRPRLGLIGMLAGWWELTLSSGCPLDS